MLALAYVIASAIRTAAPLAVALDADREVGRYVTPASAMVHALAAIAAETRDVDRYIMLSVAARESHFVALSGPRGHWPADPARMPPHLRHWIAGPCQTTESTIARAVAVREPFEGFRSCADQLGRWVAACRRWGKPVLVCSLAGFARGTRDARSGARTHVDDVLVRAARLRRAVERIESSRAGRAAS